MKLGAPASAPSLPGDSLHVVGAAIVEAGRCLSVRRSAAMSTPLRWEFPGGKVEAGELPEKALAREIREELELEIEVGRWLGRGTCPAGQKTLVLDVYLARALFLDFEDGRGQLRLREHDRHCWLAAEELPALEWAEPDIPIVPAVQASLLETSDSSARSESFRG